MVSSCWWSASITAKNGAALAEIASRRDYVRPEILEDDTLDIRSGRHPVVEAALPDPFVPNDSVMDTQGQQVLDFSLDEVREARLVPQIDFKGRRDAPAEGMQEQAAQAQAAQQRHDGPRPALHTQDETHDGGQD